MATFDIFRASVGAADLWQSMSIMVHRTAWIFDTRDERGAKAVFMAKFFATEAAQRAIDNAVQLFGGAGMERGHIIEKLYRDVLRRLTGSVIVVSRSSSFATRTCPKITVTIRATARPLQRNLKSARPAGSTTVRSCTMSRDVTR